jgi:hypothetical protein
MASPPPEEVLLRVRVQPKASRNALVVEGDGRIRVALTAPPIDGAANEALKAFLAKALSVPRRAVVLVQGEKSRDKTVSIQGVTAEHIRRTLGLTRP